MNLRAGRAWPARCLLYMETQQNNLFPDQPLNQQQRPTLLTVLCILSFINGGLTLFSSLFTGIFFGQISGIVAEIGEKFKNPVIDAWTEMLSSSSPGFFFANALFFAGSVFGAAMMWKLKKNGFHVYTISQILTLISPMYFLHLPGPSILDLLLTGAFIALYASHLKMMQ
jgi:hypothetical protein